MTKFNPDEALRKVQVKVRRSAVGRGSGCLRPTISWAQLMKGEFDLSTLNAFKQY